MLEKIKKHDNLIVCAVFIIFNAICIFTNILIISDELWNFQNVYKMVNGYAIYKEANVIITPVFFWLAKIFMQVFGANIFMFRVYNLIICTSTMILIYELFKILNVKKKMAFLYTLLIQYFIFDIIKAANYNILAETFVIAGVIISLRYFENKKFNLINAFVSYIILFTKQNIGVYYFIASSIIQLIIKENKKEAIINIVKQGLMISLMSIITFGIFYIKGILPDFISYAFLGMREFSGSNFAMETKNIVYLIIGLIAVIGSIICIKFIKNDEQKRNIIMLLVFAISMVITIYPIVNAYHTILGMLLVFALLLYLTHITILNLFEDKQILINVLIGIMIALILILCIKNIVNVKSQDIILGEVNTPYFGAIILRNEYLKIEEVNNYIASENEKAIILSSDAAWYNIPKKRNHGDMDLPFRGNMGSGGEDEMIKKISNMRGYKILIKEPLFWQESEKIINFIKENYEKVGEISDFQIYEIK